MGQEQSSESPENHLSNTTSTTVTEATPRSSQPVPKRFFVRGVFSRSSPLPTANEFHGYEMTTPGAGDRILGMAERQGEHRQKREMRELDIISRDSLLGLIFAFVFAMVALGGAIFLTYTDHPIAGTIIGGTGLVAVVSTFIQGSSHQNNEKSVKK